MNSPVRTKHKIVAGVEAELLKRVRVADGGLSRAGLARALQLAPSTVGVYVDRLVAEGFLNEREADLAESGRRPMLLTPDPSAGRFIGVDFEPHGVMSVAVDFSLGLLRRTQRAIVGVEGVDRAIKRIEAAVEGARHGDDRPLLGIGLGVPGSIDAAQGMASSYCDYIPGWDNVPVGPMLEERFGVPVRLENNIRAMTMAELWLGAGRGLGNFVCFGVRTGICAGVFVNGQLLSGAHGGAGEIGAWPAPDGRGMLEEVAGLGAIFEALRKRTGSEMNIEALREQAERAHPEVLEVLRDAADLHAGALVQLQLMFDPERIILVGPLADLGGAYLGLLRAAVRRRAQRPVAEIVASAFGHFGGAIGAAALALHQWKPAR